MCPPHFNTISPVFKNTKDLIVRPNLTGVNFLFHLKVFAKIQVTTLVQVIWFKAITLKPSPCELFIVLASPCHNENLEARSLQSLEELSSVGVDAIGRAGLKKVKPILTRRLGVSTSLEQVLSSRIVCKHTVQVKNISWDF